MDDAPQIPLSAELVRKGIHIFALVIPIGYQLVEYRTAVIWVVSAALVSLIIDLSRFRNWLLWRLISKILAPIIRAHEFKGGFTGATYILSTSALSIILFPKPIAVAAMIFIIIGDTAAALIGRKYGKHRLVGHKTIEGSLACLVSLVGVSFLVPGLPTVAGLGGALAATLAEAFSGPVDDNLTVQIVSGLIMMVIMYLMGVEGIEFFGEFSKF